MSIRNLFLHRPTLSILAVQTPEKLEGNADSRQAGAEADLIPWGFWKTCSPIYLSI